jgi:hypothetical protein
MFCFNKGRLHSKVFRTHFLKSSDTFQVEIMAKMPITSPFGNWTRDFASDKKVNEFEKNGAYFAGKRKGKNFFDAESMSRGQVYMDTIVHVIMEEILIDDIEREMVFMVSMNQVTFARTKI